jgi:hypothetical protein
MIPTGPLYAAERADENAYLDRYFEENRASDAQTRNPLFDLAGSDPAQFATIVAEDLELVKFEAARADSLINYLENLDNLFRRAADETTYITVTERQRLQKEWVSFFRSLDRLHQQAERYERDFLDMIANHKDAYFEGYMLGTVAHAATFIYGARFLHLTGGSAKLEALLNSACPEENLPEGSFDLLKKRLVGRFSMARIMYFQKHLRDFMDAFYLQTRPNMIDKDQWMVRFWEGHTEIVMAAIKEVRKNQSWFKTVISSPVFGVLFKLYYPVLTTVSNFLGDTKVRRTDYYLISDEQIADIVANLEPGDIFFERRNWYLSNIFIPGFWPHAGIYVGTFEQASEYFDRDDVQSYFRLLGYEGFGDYVEQSFPDAAASWKAPNHYDHQPNRIIESIRDGVVFSSATEAYAADFIGAVRPRLPRLDKAKAVIHALTFWGSEYDYDFNFRNDDSVFCTEFVAKAYAEDSEKLGVMFPLEKIPFGKKVVQANGMARTYSEQADTPEAQLDFVYFMKGLEDEDRAVVSTDAELRLSPDWKGLLEAGPERRRRRLQTGDELVPVTGR